MKKKILTAAIGAALLSAPVAQAAPLDLTANPVVPFTYVKPLVTANNSTVSSGGDCTTATVNVVYGVDSPAGGADSNTRHIRIELKGGKFGSVNAPVGIAGAAPLEIARTSGGNAGDIFTVFAVDTTAAILNTAQVDFNLGDVVFDAGSDAVDIIYSVYVEPDNAANKTVAPLFTKTFSSVLRLGSGVKFSVTDSQSREIDPNNDVNFVGGETTTDLSELSFDLAPATVCNNAGVQAVIDTDVKLEVSGDFSAFDGGTGTVFFSNTNTCAAPTATANPLTATSATFSNAKTTLTGGEFLCVTADGVTSLVAGDYKCKLTYSITGGTGDIVIDPQACGDLKYAGSSDRINWGLTPPSVAPTGTVPFNQYFRIANPSSTAGKVTLTLINDAGVKATVDLAAVTGVSTPLAAGASTKVFTVQQVYNAAVAANSGWTVVGVGSNKFRLIARASFGDDMDNQSGTGKQTFGDVRSTDGVILQSVTISKDGTTYNIAE